MMHDNLEHRQRANETDRSTAIPCRVTAFSLTGRPTVDVLPKQGPRELQSDGSFANLDPIEVLSIPYCFPASDQFSIFLPPAIGMEGLLIVTDTEVGEADSGHIQTSRLRDRASGYFVPTGSTAAPRGDGTALELRSGAVVLTISETAFDVTVNGISLISGLKQMSQHVAALEALVHPDGNTHGGPTPRLIDDLP